LSRWRLSFNLLEAAPLPPSPRAGRHEAMRRRARGEGAKGVRGLRCRPNMKLPWLKARGLPTETDLSRPIARTETFVSIPLRHAPFR
jgi:hypothetical protein